MEKYGFVYIWYDRKRKMYYVGCHWGTENDGYICSSNRMRDAYRRRPQDFKRKILESNINKQELHAREYAWLKLMKEDELGKRYYNLHNHHFGHWMTKQDKSGKNHPMFGKKHTEEARRKISEAQRGRSRVFSDEHKRKLSEARKGITFSEETKQKMAEAKRGFIFTDEHRRKLSEARKGTSCSKETIKKISNSNRGKTRTEEQRRRISEGHKNQVPWNKGVTGYKIKTKV